MVDEHDENLSVIGSLVFDMVPCDQTQSRKVYLGVFLEVVQERYENKQRVTFLVGRLDFF